MNEARLCISIAAETVDELIAKIERSVPFADLVEIRFDSLGRTAISQIQESKIKIPLIAAFRSESKQERLDFWDGDSSPFWACDIEEDIITKARNCERRIASFHDHAGVPPDLNAIYERLAASQADVIKIAITARDIVDAIPVWLLLKRSKAEGREMIAIAMGEAGTWSRILGPAHGGFLTYAALDKGGETAEGQITARDMLDVYRYRSIDRDTRVYGVIGDPISHSMSPAMHNAAFAATGENAVFLPLLVRDLDAFMTRMVKPATRDVELNFRGFSVTMPHKQSIIPHLDSIDATAKAIGAVNTVRIDDDGSLLGFNTDVAGFMAPLKESSDDISGLSVAVLGSGGAARAVVYALRNENAHATVFARDLQRCVWFTEQGIAVKPLSGLRSEISNFEVVVNATPIGMQSPHEAKSFLSPDELSGVRLVYDLVTRPDGTPLMHAAEAAGIPVIGGLKMLVAQGARQFEIWTGREAPIDLMRNAVLVRTGG